MFCFLKPLALLCNQAWPCFVSAPWLNRVRTLGRKRLFLLIRVTHERAQSLLWVSWIKSPPLPRLNFNRQGLGSLQKDKRACPAILWSGAGPNIRGRTWDLIRSVVWLSLAAASQTPRQEDTYARSLNLQLQQFSAPAQTEQSPRLKRATALFSGYLCRV